MMRVTLPALFLACSTAACQGMFAGRLVDAETGQPIPSAWIWVQKTGDSGFPMYKPRCERLDIVRTDADGQFRAPVPISQAGAKVGINAFAPGYARGLRWAAVKDVDGRLFVEAYIPSAAADTILITRQNMTITVPANRPPAQQQIAEAYPPLTPAIRTDDGLPLYTLWPLHAGNPRKSLGGLPSTCGDDHAAYVESTRALREALRD